MRTVPTIRAAIVGFGRSGRLHYGALANLGVSVVVVDPNCGVQAEGLPVFSSLTDLLRHSDLTVDLWVIACPTDYHLATLKVILESNSFARVLVEKPACSANEIDAFSHLLGERTDARIAVVDQYSDSSAVKTLARLCRELEPNTSPSSIFVEFTKDRTSDLTRGRYEDSSFDILGYEWLHILSVAAQFVPSSMFTRYLESDLDESTFAIERASYGARIAAIAERHTITDPNGNETRLLLYSSIEGNLSCIRTPSPHVLDRSLGLSRSAPAERWRRVDVIYEGTHAVLQLEPLPSQSGKPAVRNQNRLAIFRNSKTLYDEIVYEHVFERSVTRAIQNLLSDNPIARPPLAALRRIARIAGLFS